MSWVPEEVHLYRELAVVSVPGACVSTCHMSCVPMCAVC